VPLGGQVNRIKAGAVRALHAGRGRFLCARSVADQRVTGALDTGYR